MKQMGSIHNCHINSNGRPFFPDKLDKQAKTSHHHTCSTVTKNNVVKNLTHEYSTGCLMTLVSMA